VDYIECRVLCIEIGIGTGRFVAANILTTMLMWIVEGGRK